MAKCLSDKQHDLHIDYLLLLQSLTLIDNVRSSDTSHITGERGVGDNESCGCPFHLDNYRLIGRIHALTRSISMVRSTALYVLYILGGIVFRPYYSLMGTHRLLVMISLLRSNRKRRCV